MIWHEVQQNTPEWYALRLGIPTASSFDKIITPKTGNLSAQAEEYADRLIAERIMGEVLEVFKPSYWMERGHILEAQARALYEFETGYETKHGGFLTNDSATIGASPDVLVLNSSKVIGGAEIKCPAPWTHVSNLLRGNQIDPAYIPQTQGQILVGGFEFVDWFSYHPSMPPALVRVLRDNAYSEKMAVALDGFVNMLAAKIERLKALGIDVAAPKASTISLEEAARIAKELGGPIK